MQNAEAHPSSTNAQAEPQATQPTNASKGSREILFISILKIFAWLEIAAAAIGALGFILGLMIGGASVGFIIAVQGLFFYALLNAIISITENLIAIREKLCGTDRNTAVKEVVPNAALNQEDK